MPVVCTGFPFKMHMNVAFFISYLLHTEGLRFNISMLSKGSPVSCRIYDSSRPQSQTSQLLSPSGVYGLFELDRP